MTNTDRFAVIETYLARLEGSELLGKLMVADGLDRCRFPFLPSFEHLIAPAAA